MVFLKVLIDYYTMEKMGEFRRNWTKKEYLRDLKPWFNVVLQNMSFYLAFDKMFEHTRVSEENKMHALDLVRSLLKFDPKEPSLKEVLNIQDIFQTYLRL